MRAFERSQLATAERELLRDGRFANARVERVRIDGVDWIFKDFSSRAFLVRQGIGRFLLQREVRALRRLEGIPGVPSRAFRVDAFAMAARFVPGRTLARVEAAQVSTDYLVALEALLGQVHARGLVHLDTRGGGNLLMTPVGTPGIIDFQAALSTRWMPAAMRTWFEAMDLSGVYKKWQAWQPETMGAQRLASFERLNRWRRWWLLRGYFGLRKKRPRPDSAAP
jgi:tRNA A-37 threonylcarbamoyl transferase component Bud32